MNVNTVNAILDAIQDDMKKVYQIVTDSGHVFYLNGLTSQNTPRFQVTIDRDQGIFNLNDTKDTRYGDTVIEFANISTFNFFEEASTLIGAITGADGTKSGGSGTATPYTAATLPDPATLAPGATVVLTGTFAADVTSVLLITHTLHLIGCLMIQLFKVSAYKKAILYLLLHKKVDMTEPSLNGYYS